ncbi:hypothetical protein [Rhizobium johnstonii]|uniref:hypothetical protein n=1 Tax=Rhizobium johnstonii TaxID=3019933 RepID=UPI003F9D4D6B
MTLQASGSMTGADIRDELRQSGGDLVFPDPTTRWLADLSAGSVIIPTDYYGKAAVKQTDAQNVVGSGTTWNVTVNLGIDFPGRRFVVCIIGYAASTASQVLVVGPNTLGGQTITLGPGQARFNPSTNVAGGILYSSPSAVTGTSGTLHIVFNQTVIRFRCVVYSISNISTLFHSNSTGSGSATSLNTTVNVDTNGVVVAMAFKDNATSMTLSGVVEDSDAGSGGNVRMVTGWENRLASQTARPIGTTGQGAADLMGLAVISFGT